MKLAILLAISGLFSPPQGFDVMSIYNSPMMLLARPDIKKELKLTKDQSKQADATMKEVQNAGKDAQANPMAAMNAMKKANEDLVAMLDETQKVRFYEIRWQAMGVNSLLDPPMKEALALTDEQFEAVKKSRSDLINTWLEQARGGKPDQKKLEKLAKDREEQTLAMLTEKQRETYKEKLGKLFPNARMKGTPPF